MVSLHACWQLFNLIPSTLPVYHEATRAFGARMRHTGQQAALLNYATPDESWSGAEVWEMLAGMAALAFIGFSLLCLVYTVALGAMLVGQTIWS